MSEMPSVYEFAEDIANAEAPPPLPVGEYRASVVTVEAGISKSSGRKMMTLTYRVTPDQYPPDYKDGNPDGETLRVYASLEDTPMNRFRLRKLCEMHGVAASKRLVLTEFIGTEVMLNIEHEEYNGAPQARATPVRPI